MDRIRITGNKKVGWARSARIDGDAEDDCQESEVIFPLPAGSSPGGVAGGERFRGESYPRELGRTFRIFGASQALVHNVDLEAN